MSEFCEFGGWGRDENFNIYVINSHRAFDVMLTLPMKIDYDEWRYTLYGNYSFAFITHEFFTKAPSMGYKIYSSTMHRNTQYAETESNKKKLKL